MATRDEMSKIITDMDIDAKAWIVVTAWDDFEKFPEDFTKTVIWYALLQAEYKGMCFNGYNGVYVKDEPCTYWLVGDYVVTYLTDDLDFCVDMLTEDMMDDLIIEEA